MNLQQLAKWKKHLDIIQRDIGHAVFHRTLFRDVTDMVKRNPAVDDTSIFFGFLANVYFDSVLLAIRRQVKTGDSVSLAQLLLEVEANAPQFTREWFYGLYAGTTPGSIMARDFARFAGPEAAHIDPALVRADAARISSACQAAEAYVDKRIAHWDRTPPRMPLTVTAVDAALDVLADSASKYYLLLFCVGLDIHPVAARPVYHVFTVPWWTPKPPGDA